MSTKANFRKRADWYIARRERRKDPLFSINVRDIVYPLISIVSHPNLIDNKHHLRKKMGQYLPIMTNANALLNSQRIQQLRDFTSHFLGLIRKWIGRFVGASIAQ